MDKNKTKKILLDCWSKVEKDYKNNSLCSERSLQADIYANLRSIIDENCKILVEPSIEKYIPDIVLVDSSRVLCIMEIKFAPHWWVSGSSLNSDIDKLYTYSNLREFEPVIFGPKRVFDTKNKKWFGQRTIFTVSENTIFCFAVITRKESPCSTIKKLKAYSINLNKIENFCLLSGVVSVNEVKLVSSEKFFIESTF